MGLLPHEDCARRTAPRGGRQFDRTRPWSCPGPPSAGSPSGCFSIKNRSLTGNTHSRRDTPLRWVPGLHPTFAKWQIHQVLARAFPAGLIICQSAWSQGPSCRKADQCLNHGQWIQPRANHSLERSAGGYETALTRLIGYTRTPRSGWAVTRGQQTTGVHPGGGPRGVTANMFPCPEGHVPAPRKGKFSRPGRVVSPLLEITLLRVAVFAFSTWHPASVLGLNSPRQPFGRPVFWPLPRCVLPRLAMPSRALP